MELILNGLSAAKLRELAAKATALANDLEATQPSYALAIENGVQDTSYDTVANGIVKRYEGTAIVKLANGTYWRAIGHGPVGSAGEIDKDGYIEFIPFGK